MSGNKRQFSDFKAAMAASASSFRDPRPPPAPRVSVGERHAWVRPNQTLLFDKAKETGKIATYHIPVRLPPVGGGFRGFTYDADGNLGMGEEVKGPLYLVGLVIEVMVRPFTCKNDRDHTDAEGDTFSLDTPIAKPIYGLLEDAQGRIHAIALSLIKPSTLIKGKGLADRAYNWSGSAPKVGRTDTPAENQGSVVGIQVHNQELCPAGTAPVFRVSWGSSRSRALGEIKFFDLVSIPYLAAPPGYWLTYKRMNCATLTSLKMDRLELPEVNQLYSEAEAEVGRTEDGANDPREGGSASSTKLPRLDPCGALRWESSLMKTAPRKDEVLTGRGVREAGGDTAPGVVVQVPSIVGDAEVPSVGLEGPLTRDLTRPSDSRSLRDSPVLLVGQPVEENTESEEGGMTSGGTLRDLGGEESKDTKLDLITSPMCSFHQSLEKAGIMIAEEMIRKDCCHFDPEVGSFCQVHAAIAYGLVEVHRAGVKDRQDVHLPSRDETENHWRDPENALVEGSKYWTPQRGRGKGQSFPPPSVWSQESGLISEPAFYKGPRLLKSERRTQLELINREYRLAFYLRQYFPKRAQPYPIYWNMDLPLPNSDTILTMAEDIVSNFDLVGGLGQLVDNHLVVLMKVEPRWTPGLDMLGLPHLPQPFRVMIGRVAEYDPTMGTLRVHPTETSSELEKAAYIHFDQEHLARAVEDLTEYWKWCINWIQAKLSDQVDYTDARAGYQYVLLGRLPAAFVERYTNWMYRLDYDQGLHTLLLRALNPEEYDRRRTVGTKIYNQEVVEMRSYGIPACTSNLSDSDLELLLRCHPRPSSEVDLEKRVRTAAAKSVSGMSDTPLSAKVRRADPRVVSRESLYLLNQLFEQPKALDSGSHVRWEDQYQSFSTPQKYDDYRRDQLSGGAQLARPHVVWRTPSGRGGSYAREISSQASPGSNVQATKHHLGRTPVPVSALTPEIERLAALRNSGDYPNLGKFGARNVVGKSPGKDKGPGVPDEHGGSSGDSSPSDEEEMMPVKPEVPSRRSALRDHTTPIGDLGADFRREPSGGVPGGRAAYRELGGSLPRRAGLENLSDTRDLMDTMRRMAVATESSARVKTQGDIYKDLNLLPLQYEMLSNPTLGAVLTMIPSVYHIYGVRGHLSPLTPQMNGPARYRSTMDYLYYDAPWVDPALLLELRIRLTPRILIVLSFGIFKGTMAFHPSDIVTVSEDSLLDMATPGFHLSGKSLPASGLPKLTPPEPHKLTTNFTAFWELLDHFVLLFSLIYGEGHRLPLNLLIQDLKDLQRKDHGLTTRETADLFSRILGYHQDKIIAAFTERGGLLSHIQTQEELLAEAARDDIDTELMPRLVPWPRFTPGSPAYNTFYLGPREFLYQYQRDLSVRRLREEAEAARSKKPVKKFGQGPPAETPDPTYEEGSEDGDMGAFGVNIKPRDPPGNKDPPADSKPDKPKKKQVPRPKPFVLTTEQMAKGTYALFELQQHLLTTKTLKQGQEICIRFLSHNGCTKCDRVHLPKEALSGVTISPWLKMLMITHKGYRGDKALPDVAAQLNGLARLVKQGSA